MSKKQIICYILCVFLGNNDKPISEHPGQKSSIDNIYQPLPHLQETETIKSTLNTAKNKHKLILHCYGVPGSGKSQLVRTLAKKFPYGTYEKNSLYIKWHIQCKDTGDDLQKEFQHLAEKLQENYLARTDDVWQSIEKEFRKNQANKFLEMLLNCKIPILIVLEDPAQKDQNLLQDFFCRLDKDFEEINHSPFHVYITSRIKSPIIAPMMSLHLEGYEVINVVGFNQEEGINFLERYEGEAIEAREDLIKVFNRFSGMPLGMLAAKGFCRYADINYKDYLELAEDNDYDILLEEKEAILQEYGQSAEHIFQAVVMPFMPEEESSGSFANLDLHWQVLCCISNFHYDRLPRFLVEACFNPIHEQKAKISELRNKKDAGILLRKLVDHGMCTKAENGQFITFHEVVLNAFRFKAQSVHNFKSLVKAMEVMCNLVSIDMREKENFDKMCMLRPHLQALLLQVKKNETMLEKVMDVSLLKAITSHLYEIAGAILLCEMPSEESENMFKESLKTIWPTVLEVICRKDQSKDELVQMIFDESQVKREELPSNFILRYASWIKLSHFDEPKHNFLRSQSKCSYEKVEALVKQCNFKELVIKLQKCKLFLSDESFRPIFYAERAASILHRWSRYCSRGSGGHQTVIEMGLRLSRLSNAISILVREMTGVPLMTEWLSYTTGMIPLLMEQKTKPESLLKAKDVCKTMIEKENLIVYENGLLAKAFYPPAVTQMYLLRHLVQINGRLISRRIVKDQAFLQEAEEKCRQLYILANDKTNVSCGKAFVVCGKYYGAKEDYSQAIHCFNKYFELSTTPDLKQKFYTECWAVYNYARAVCCFPSSGAKIDAIERCKAVLSTNKVITIDLKQHLEKILIQLECPETLPK